MNFLLEDTCMPVSFNKQESKAERVTSWFYYFKKAIINALFVHINNIFIIKNNYTF